MPSKQCSKCGEIKPADEFAKDKSRHDGLNCWCKVCKRLRSAIYYREHVDERTAYYYEHRDGKLEYLKSYHAEHRDVHLAQMREYYAEHRDELLSRNKVYMRSYYRKHRDTCRVRIHAFDRSDVGRACHAANSHNRRIQGGSQLTGAVIHDVVEASNGICPYCGKSFKEGHMDHIVPLSRGGTNDRSNLVYVCKKCNLAKGASTLEEFRAMEVRNE